MGPTRLVEAALQQLFSGMARIGLQLNLAKCVVWGPGLANMTPNTMMLQQMKEIPWAPGTGVTVLGSPVTYPGDGEAFIRTFWQAKLQEMKTLLDRISVIGHSQFEHCLLRACADVCRVNHLLRSTSTLLIADILGHMEQLLGEAAERLVGKPLEPQHLQQIFMPIKYGGLGVRNPVDLRDAARVAAVTSYLKDFTPQAECEPAETLERIPEDFITVVMNLRMVLGPEVQPLKDWSTQPEKAKEIGHRLTVQQAWQEKVTLRRRRDWLESGTLREKARKALLTPQSGAWMTGLPSATFNTEFEHCDYRLALSWQLGLPLLPADTMGERCAQCGLCLDAFGDHAVSCKGNGITVRHGVIQDWLLERAKEAGIACTKEAGLEDRTRPGDVLLHAWAGQGPLAVDVTCVNPLRPSESRPAPDKVRKFLLEEEHRKNAKYQEHCSSRGWTFMPLVTHPFAGTTSLGGQFLHRLSRLYAENTAFKPTKSERVQLFWQTFSCSVMKQVACQLRLTTYTGPQPVALLPLPRLDEAGNEIAALSLDIGPGTPRPKRPRSTPSAGNITPRQRPEAAGASGTLQRDPLRTSTPSRTGSRTPSTSRSTSHNPYPR